jgi:stage V sporulation protein R
MGLMRKAMQNKRMEEITQLALDNGLEPFPVVFETVERSTMTNVVSYGLPTKARHWSYGRSYDYQKTYGEMGYSKIYEVILNNNPSYAFMLDTNTEVQNIFITAHCLGHSDFFKNNCTFKDSDRNMIYHAAEHAGRIEQYIETYGFEKVEHLMDIAFALDEHIDWHKGLIRKPYGGKRIITCYKKCGEFDDVAFTKPVYTTRSIENGNFPPHPERDLLWFFINYAPLEDWERDVLDIVREESYYFYPQKMTKIMNEGWASYWHAELMFQYDLNPEEYLDFVRTHEKVVQPGDNPFRINPYYLGFKIFKDIEKRWDEEYGKGAGKQKIFEVRTEEDDISFLRNYLTTELVDKLNLFTYGYIKDYAQDYTGERFIEIKERFCDEIVESLVRPIYNGGAPKIVITGIGQEGTLLLNHDNEEFGTFGTLDNNFVKRTIEYIWDLWAAPVELHTKNDDGGSIAICFDEAGAYERDLEEELSFIMEEEEEKKPVLCGNRIIIP